MARVTRKVLCGALGVAKKWLRRDEVVAVGIGLRRRAGSHTAEPAIVVTVRWKRTPDRLRELRVAHIPKVVRVQLDGRTFDVPVDVQGAKGRLRGSPSGLVACPLDTDDARFGVVSALVSRGAQRFILTAAHVVRQLGRGVVVIGRGRHVRGTVSEIHAAGNLDHALIQSTETLAPSEATFPLGEPLAGVRASSTLRLGELVFFRKRNGQLRQVSILKVDETVDFNMPVGSTRFSGVVSTSLASERGDSGALLYDNNFRAVGTLLGGFGAYSCFLPCQPSFGRLNVTLFREV
ncbi:MAG: trypsin-like peptidase domain-containing protein [Candidatus Binatia bacterium]